MFGFIGNFGPWEMAMILVVILIVVGPGKLPQLGESVGKAMNSFKKAKEDNGEFLEEAVKENE